jgi:hypothetical protein
MNPDICGHTVERRYVDNILLARRPRRYYRFVESDLEGDHVIYLWSTVTLVPLGRYIAAPVKSIVEGWHPHDLHEHLTDE